MKWIKLFENFSDEIVENNKMANDVVEDIKTISYLLEDEGFELKYSFRAETGSSFEVDEYNKLINNPRVVQQWTGWSKIGRIAIKVIGNSITDPKTFQQTLTNKSKEIIERYIDLLKEHLDYINPENITTQISLMGYMNIIIKL
jgi:hypothetical protein